MPPVPVGVQGQDVRVTRCRAIEGLHLEDLHLAADWSRALGAHRSAVRPAPSPPRMSLARRSTRGRSLRGAIAAAKVTGERPRAKDPRRVASIGRCPRSPSRTTSVTTPPTRRSTPGTGSSSPPTSSPPGPAAGVLAAGGNAVDAAVAANAVVGVVLPDTCGPGGDLFALVHRPGDPAPAALNASGRAGSGADPERLRREGLTAVPFQGPEGITVPGCVDGWEALLARFGTWSLSDVLAPAIAVADGGFEASPELAASLGATTELLAGQPSAGALPTPADGRRHRGRCCSAVAWPRRCAPSPSRAARASTAGPSVPPSPRQPVACHRRRPGNRASRLGGPGRDDGARAGGVDGPTQQSRLHHPRRRLGRRAAGLGARVRPAHPPPHRGLPGGGRRLRRPRRRPRQGPAWKPPISSRPTVCGRCVDAIDSDAAGVWPPPAPAAGGTTYLCCRDGAGMGVSLIQSNFHGIGSGLSAGDTGVFLHDRGAGFCLVPGHANELVPGNRPAHTLSPTLWTVGGGLRILLGHARRLLPAADPPPADRPHARRRARPGRGDSPAPLGDRRRGDRPERRPRGEPDGPGDRHRPRSPPVTSCRPPVPGRSAGARWRPSRSTPARSPGRPTRGSPPPPSAWREPPSSWQIVWRCDGRLPTLPRCGRALTAASATGSGQHRAE